MFVSFRKLNHNIPFDDIVHGNVWKSYLILWFSLSTTLTLYNHVYSSYLRLEHFFLRRYFVSLFIISNFIIFSHSAFFLPHFIFLAFEISSRARSVSSACYTLCFFSPLQNPMRPCFNAYLLTCLCNNADLNL